MLLLFNRNLIFSILLLFLFSLIQFTLAENCANEQYKNGALTSDNNTECSDSCVSYICKYGNDFYTGEMCIKKVSKICNSHSMKEAKFFPYGQDVGTEIAIDIGRYILVKLTSSPTDSSAKYEYFNSLLEDYNGGTFIDDSLKTKYVWVKAISLSTTTTIINQTNYLSWAADAKLYIPSKLDNWTTAITEAQLKAYEMANKFEDFWDQNIEDIKRAGIQNFSNDNFEELRKNAAKNARNFANHSSETFRNEEFKLRQFNDEISALINTLTDSASFDLIKKYHNQILDNVAESEVKVLSLTKTASDIIQSFKNQMVEIQNAGNDAREALANVKNGSNGKKIAEFQIAFMLFALAFIRFVF